MPDEQPSSNRIAHVVALVAVLDLLFGCSISPTFDNENDPYESENRAIFESSQQIDHAIIRPATRAYRLVIPRFGRDILHNVIVNLDCPVVFANDWLQAEMTKARQTFGRCAVNSILGLGGLFDVASRLDIPYHGNDFGLTLQRWGVEEGPYLFVPLLGPSNPRDLTGAVVDVALQPEIYASFRYKAYWELGRFDLKYFDARAENFEIMNDIERTSVDLYAAERNIYRQHRRGEAKSLPQMMPDF